MHQSTIKRAERVRRIVAEHYEEGNLRRCKSAIYRRYVRDELGISQRTYFRLLSAIVPSLNTRPAPMQLSLF